MFDENTRVLVVDDFATMRRIVKNLLRGLNITKFQEADDGETALPLLDTHEFDLIVTDWNMPKMDGLDLLKAVRAHPKHCNTPVLMVTAESKREQIVMAANAGVNGYIVKPFTAATLEEKLKKIAERLG